MDTTRVDEPSPRTAVPVLVAVTALTVLVVLTVAVVAADGPLPGEIAYIRWWQRLDQPVPVFADVVRHATSTEANVAIGVLPAIWVIRRHGRRGAAAVLICLASMVVVQPVSKELVDRDRPSEEQVDVRRGHSSRSYPSGHSLSTTTTFGAYALVAWHAGRRRRPRAAMLAVPIGCTFVSGAIHGVHWPSDAVAGTIMGAFAAWGAVRVLRVVPAGPGRRD